MNLLRTLAAVSSMTMLSRVTGLLRESLFAATFGASGMTDAFNVAFRLPNLLRRLFAEGAFSQAFVPILAEYKTKYGNAATKSLSDHVATVLLWATLAVSLLGMIAAPVLVYMMATGLDQESGAFSASVFMTRLMFPYIACMSFVALAGGVLNTWRKFQIPAFTPVLLNLSFIAAALLIAPHLAQPVYAMAIGVMAGGILQVAIQIPALLRIGMLPRIGLNPFAALKDDGVRRVMIKMGPAVFAVSASQLSLIINTNIASNLGPGAITSLSYADRLMELPSALLGVALGTILLPSLAKASNQDDATEYTDLLNWGLRLTFLLALPAAVGMAVLATPLIATLFHYGNFKAPMIAASAAPLVAYAVGLIGIILVKTLAPAFYSRQDIRTPVRIAIGVMIATQLLNVVFVKWWGLGVAGLALSIGAGACLNAAFLFYGLRKIGIYQGHQGWLPFFARLAPALTAMGGLAWIGARQLDWVAMQAHPVLRVAALGGLIGACVAVYFGVLFMLGFRLRDFRRTVH